jgi:ribosomal protein S28E/S33
LGIFGTHPAVFVRVANTGVTGYVKRVSVEVIENKEEKNERAKGKDNAER